jgi:hypothetical protein
MKVQLSPKDWQQISEYLDDQLTPKEKNRLEERIRVRPELRNGLEELRHTRLVLRSVPKRRAPHNFTLTPEMVRPRSISRLFPVLSFSSALATILIVVTLVFRLLPGESSSSTAEVQRFAAPAAPAAPFAASAAQNKSSGAQSSQTPEIITWGQPANQMFANNIQGMGGGPGQSSPAGAAPLIAPGAVETQPSQEAPPQAPGPMLSSPLATPKPGLSQPEAPALEAPTNAVPATANAANADALRGTSPILGIPARSDQGKIIPAPSESTAAEAAAPQPTTQSFPYWILLEIALVVIAAVTGLAAYSLWRKAKM